MRSIIKSIVIVTIVSISLLSNCTTNIDEYFTGKGRGKTVQGYMRYGAYDVWDHFVRSEKYSFRIANKEKKGYLDIAVELLNGTKENLPEIISNEINNERKRHEIQGDKYFKVLCQKKLTINGNDAVLLKYQYNSYNKKRSDYNKYFVTIEICYIFIKNYIVKISSSGFEDFIVPIRKNWEQFYSSFHDDHSRKYKTNFGSFDFIENVVDDGSRISYSIPNTYYAIVIHYIPDNEKNEYHNSITSFPWVKKKAARMPGMEIKQEKNETLIVDGKKASYVEYVMVDTKKGKRSRSMYFIINEFSPALEITVFAEEQLFEFYRGEMELLLKSLKFDR